MVRQFQLLNTIKPTKQHQCGIESSMTLQPSIEFDNFKPRLKSSIFKYVSWQTVHYFGAMIGFHEKVSQPYLMTQNSPLDSPNNFLSSHLLYMRNDEGFG